jgi:hypothetical protein
MWCEHCQIADATRTESDDELWRDSDVVSVDGGNRIVSVPYARDHYYQDSDGDWHSEPPGDYETDDADAEDSGALYPYGTNILGKLDWPENAKREALVFGVELEVEPVDYNTHDQIELARALGGRRGDGYILAADGSLEYGVEIITLPQTLEQHHTGAVVHWREITKRLAEKKARSGQGTDRCGMHVHINKRALSALTVGKMLVCVNSDEMRPLVELVAQRSESQYAQRKPKKFTDALADDGTHYDALNISTEHDTLELRIFRGNTRYSRVMKNLEFAHALCIYCRDASMQDVTKPELMRAWICARPAIYPHLSKYLTERTED